MNGKISRDQRFATYREPGNADGGYATEFRIPDGFRLDCIPHRIYEIPARPMDAGKRLFVRMESLEKRDKWVDIEISLYMEDY